MRGTSRGRSPSAVDDEPRRLRRSRRDFRLIISRWHQLIHPPPARLANGTCSPWPWPPFTSLLVLPAISAGRRYSSVCGLLPPRASSLAAPPISFTPWTLAPWPAAESRTLSANFHWLFPPRSREKERKATKC